jgi:hypothetical protein
MILSGKKQELLREDFTEDIFGVDLIEQLIKQNPGIEASSLSELMLSCISDIQGQNTL